MPGRAANKISESIDPRRESSLATKRVQSRPPSTSGVYDMQERSIFRGKARTLTAEELTLVSGGEGGWTTVATNIGPNGDTEQQYDPPKDHPGF